MRVNITEPSTLMKDWRERGSPSSIVFMSCGDPWGQFLKFLKFERRAEGSGVPCWS